MQDLDVKKSTMLALFVFLRLMIAVCTIVRPYFRGDPAIYSREDRNTTNISRKMPSKRIRKMPYLARKTGEGFEDEGLVKRGSEEGAAGRGTER